MSVRALTCGILLLALTGLVGCLEPKKNYTDTTVEPTLEPAAQTVDTKKKEETVTAAPAAPADSEKSGAETPTTPEATKTADTPTGTGDVKKEEETGEKKDSSEEIEFESAMKRFQDGINVLKGKDYEGLVDYLVFDTDTAARDGYYKLRKWVGKTVQLPNSRKSNSNQELALLINYHNVLVVWAVRVFRLQNKKLPDSVWKQDKTTRKWTFNLGSTIGKYQGLKIGFHPEIKDRLMLKEYILKKLKFACDPTLSAFALHEAAKGFTPMPEEAFTAENLCDVLKDQKELVEKREKVTGDAVYALDKKEEK